MGCEALGLAMRLLNPTMAQPEPKMDEERMVQRLIKALSPLSQMAQPGYWQLSAVVDAVTKFCVYCPHRLKELSGATPPREESKRA
jgi:hypothetical protein